jgi:predicted DNA-binding protein (UPF0251 family)
MKQMTRINILLPVELADAFRQRCKDGETSMVKVVRAFIEREIREPPLTVKTRSRMTDEQLHISAIRKDEQAKRKIAVIRSVTVDGMRLKDAAEKFGMSKSGVSRILSRAGVSI